MFLVYRLWEEKADADNKVQEASELAISDGIWGVLCIIAGAQVPFVVRSIEGGGRYRLVGECFVYGLVHKQDVGLREYEFKDIELQ